MTVWEVHRSSRSSSRTHDEGSFASGQEAKSMYIILTSAAMLPDARRASAAAAFPKTAI